MRPIDADALKNAYFNAINETSIGEVSIIDIIENAPTLEPDARPSGEWLIVKQDNEGIHEIECPFCKYSQGSDFNAVIKVTFDRLPSFCENCGADMRGEDNEVN